MLCQQFVVCEPSAGSLTSRCHCRFKKLAAELKVVLPGIASNDNNACGSHDHVTYCLDMYGTEHSIHRASHDAVQRFCPKQYDPDCLPQFSPAKWCLQVLAFNQLAGVVQLHAVSFFEKGNNAHFNSLAWIDADGSLLGVYRKSHIPDGPG